MTASKVRFFWFNLKSYHAESMLTKLSCDNLSNGNIYQVYLSIKFFSSEMKWFDVFVPFSSPLSVEVSG